MPRILSIKFIIYLLFLIIFQMGVMPYLVKGPVHIAWLHLFVVYLVFFHRASGLLGLVLLVGFIRDAAGSLPLGAGTLGIFIAAWLLDFYVKKTYRDFWLLQVIGVFLFVFLALWIEWIVVAWIFSGHYGMSDSFFVLLLSALGSSVFALPFFWFAKWWFQVNDVNKQYELFKK